MSKHYLLIGDELHVAAVTVADAAALAVLVATLVAADVGKLVLQVNTGSLWKCTAAATVQPVPVVFSVANITVPPTDAELDGAFGTAAVVGAGFMGIVDDNGAHTTVYITVSDGTNWWYTAAMTKAV